MRLSVSYTITTLLIRTQDHKFTPGNECSWERKVSGTKVPRNEKSKERKFPRTKGPGNESAREQNRDLLFLGTKGLGHEKSVILRKAGCEQLAYCILIEPILAATKGHAKLCRRGRRDAWRSTMVGAAVVMRPPLTS